MLDLKIVFIISIFILFVLAVYILIRYIQSPNNRSLKFLTFYASFYFVGFVLIILRNQIPDFLSIVIANTLLISAAISLYIAIRALLNLDAQWHSRYVIPIVVVFISHSLFTYVYYDLKTKLIVFALFYVLFSMIFAWLFWFNSSSKFRLFDRASSLFFLSGVFIFFSFVIHSIYISFYEYFFRNNDIFINVPLIYMICVNIWVAILVKYRISKK